MAAPTPTLARMAHMLASALRWAADRLDPPRRTVVHVDEAALIFDHVKGEFRVEQRVNGHG